MHLKRFSIPVISGFSLLLGACATGPQQPAEPAFEELWDAAAEDPRVSINAAVLSGELAAQRGLAREAAEYYLRAARQADQPQLAARATQLALQAESAELALQASERWIELNPEEDGAYEIAARLALREEQWDRVVELLRTVLHRPNADPDAGLIGVAEVLAVESLPASRALDLYRQIGAGLEAVPSRALGEALLAYRLDDFASAEAAVAQALQQKPDWRQAQLLSLRLHLQQGRREPAKHLIRDLHVADPTDLDLRLALGQLLLENEELELARKEYSKALKIDPAHSGARYAIALIDMDQGRLESAEKNFRRLRQEPERRADASYYLGRLAEQRENWQEALSLYGEVTEGRRILDASIRQAVVMARLGDLSSARVALNNLRHRFEDQELRLYQVEAELLFQMHQDQAAAEVYEEALRAYPADTDLLYGRAVVRERLGQVAKAEQDLRSILRMEPNDARALNALGYMLSNHSQRYAEAREYVSRALEITPDDPAVIDSMGWLYYREGKLDQARVYLERAHQELSDPEISAHLGEVLWQQGERERARRVWGEALKASPGHPVLMETIQRLDSAI